VKEKKWKRLCPQCGKEESFVSIKIRNRLQQNLTPCRSCSSRGVNNPFYGRKHTDKTKKVIGQTTIARDQKGENNPFYGRKHSLESRQNISNSRALGIANGSITNTNGFRTKTWYESNKTNCKVFCESLLERFRFIQLDSDPTIKSWTKQHTLKIPYEYMGEQHRYVPDLFITLITGETLIEEIKGYDKKSKFKEKALSEYCANNGIQYRWIDQTHLESLGYREFVKKFNEENNCEKK